MRCHQVGLVQVPLNVPLTVFACTFFKLEQCVYYGDYLLLVGPGLKYQSVLGVKNVSRHLKAVGNANLV